MPDVDDAPIDSSRIRARVTLDTSPGGGWGETQVILQDREVVVLTRSSVLDAFRRLPIAAGALPTLVGSGDDSALRLPVVGGDVDLDVPLRSRDDVRRFVGRLAEVEEWTNVRDEPATEPAPVSTPPISRPVPAPHAPPLLVSPSRAVVNAREALVDALEERRAALEAGAAPSMPAGAKKKRKKTAAVAAPARPIAASGAGATRAAPVPRDRPIGWADRLVWIATAIALIVAGWVLLSKR